VSYYDPTTRNPAISRRPGNRRSDDWIRALLARVQVCRVATLWGEQPFINPTTFVYRPQTSDHPQHDIVFHSNLAGRVRANAERAETLGTHVCFEASEIGRLLPSNDPLELSMQYRSVIVFGTVSLLEDDAARQGLTDLCTRMFPALRQGTEMKPISENDLARTSVYSISISNWSGKENWEEAAMQTEEWPELPEEIL
jgi:uncharacterized protein